MPILLMHPCTNNYTDPDKYINCSLTKSIFTLGPMLHLPSCHGGYPSHRAGAVLLCMQKKGVQRPAFMRAFWTLIFPTQDLPLCACWNYQKVEIR